MNKLEPSATCRICGLDLGKRWNVAELIRMRVEWNRQMANGICDGCQCDRLDAAIEYENAGAELRQVLHLGADWKRGRPTSMPRELRYARWRLRKAEAACVRLKMWSANLPAREG